MKVLVINTGSSSIKYQLYQMPAAKVLAKGIVENITPAPPGSTPPAFDGEVSKLTHFYGDKTYSVEKKVEDHEGAMGLILNTLVGKDVGVINSTSEIAAVGHRVVHGGQEFTGSVVIDDKVIASIEKFADLAPLHNPANLMGIRAAQHNLPNAEHVACFDTAFHTTIPEVAYMYALPYEFYEKYRIRRYGFHGTSHRYVVRRAAALMDKDKYDINAITCHLGNGCSVTAVKQGKSIDTSMGLTPLEGVPMGTRSGDFDPAILFYLADKGYDVKTLNTLCNKKSGLLGISGASNDMRNLEELARRPSGGRVQKDNARAKLAIDIFCYRITKYIGAYTAILGTLDVVVFTGGIGENAVSVRQQICTGLTQIGIRLDPVANQAAIGREADISDPDSRIKVFVIPTNEEAAIANDTYELTRRRTSASSRRGEARRSPAVEPRASSRPARLGQAKTGRPGKNEVIMSQQNTYRNLTQAELKILQDQGCIAEDWDLVEVADGFDPARVRNTQFLGHVRIGRPTLKTQNSKLKTQNCGIYNATIADCTIGDNTRISNIGVHIANYDIASDVCIENVATMATRPGATFGNGVEVVALNEAGGREVVIFDELSVQFAYLMCLHRYRPVLIKNLSEIARSYIETVRCDRGKIGQGARIFSTTEILDLNVGPHAVINTAASLVNGTILSSAEAPTLVGSNVVAEDFIIAEGTSVTGTVNLKKVYIGQGCRIGNQFSAENSLFFANSEAFLGEACSVFAGPYTVSHHKSTLLIACLLSFYNAGSGTNQSNHMYKLGPVHEGKLERGIKAGSFSYVIWPCRVGPFSILLGKHTRSFDTSVFPFAHLEADANGRCSMVPGLYLTAVGTMRDEAKWRSRDRRKGTKKRDIISFDVFSPYTVGKMIKACSILRKLQENTDRSVEDVAIDGVRMKRVLLRTSQKLYRTGIDMYLLEKILTKAEKYIDGGIEKIRKAFAAPADGAVYSRDWVDIGGQFMPRQRLLDVTAAIESGKIADFKTFNTEMDKIHQAVEKDEWLWVKNAYEEAFNRDLEKLAKAEFVEDIEAYQKVKTKYLKLVLVDAEKEFSQVSRTGFGQDGSADDLSEDFSQVRGQYDQNKFVRQIHDNIKETERRVKRLKREIKK